MNASPIRVPHAISWRKGRERSSSCQGRELLSASERSSIVIPAILALGIALVCAQIYQRPRAIDRSHG